MVYRVVAIALLAGITYYCTGNAGEATTITILFNVMGTASYYGLERLWEYVLWGRGKLATAASEAGSKPSNPFIEGARVAPSPGSLKTDSEVK